MSEKFVDVLVFYGFESIRPGDLRRFSVFKINVQVGVGLLGAVITPDRGVVYTIQDSSWTKKIENYVIERK